MKNRERILAEFQAVPENTLIMSGKLYREKFSKQMSETAFTQAISRLSKSGEIVRISKGIYCMPKKTRFGAILPSDREIVDLFTKQNNGVIVGYGLYNSLGVTTQVSKRPRQRPDDRRRSNFEQAYVQAVDRPGEAA